MKRAESFKDLVVYQKAQWVAHEVFVLSGRFPSEERFSLTDQMRRSSRSVGAQIAEAWAKRRYEKHFISKLTDADGEQLETQHWLDTAVTCGYLATEKRDLLNHELQTIGRMLSSMMTKSAAFCSGGSGSLREDVSVYHAATDCDESAMAQFFEVNDSTPLRSNTKSQATDHRSPITDHSLS